jgi:hypothetical protein
MALMRPDALAWVQQHYTTPCPDHGGRIKRSTIMGTFWCPTCQCLWRVRTPTLPGNMGYDTDRKRWFRLASCGPSAATSAATREP